MYWVRIQQEGMACWGTVTEGVIHVCSSSPLRDHLCAAHCGLERLPLEGARLLPPCEPTKIVCVGRNYGAHAREMNEPVPAEPLFFLKPPSALLGAGDTIRLPPLSRQVEYEGEVGVVIRQRCRNLGPNDDIRPYLLGFTCVNDVTARDLQRRDSQWTRAKGFDTFCPVGPGVAALPEGATAPWEDLTLETSVNGQLRQRATTAEWVFGLPELLRAITAVMTLEPGDLIATGTPAGVGPLHPGDRVSVTVSGVGSLENPVAAA